MPTEKQSLGNGEVEMYCESWKLTVETKNAGSWGQVPEKCLEYVIKYMSGKQYMSDSEVVTENALAFLKKLPSTCMGKDACRVFDIDETLFGNVLYFITHVNGSQEIDEDFMNDFIELAIAPPLPASLRLYKVVQALGFKIFLLTGRSDSKEMLQKLT
ncbi:hypothetical protein DH2020_001956 [Rehmannia glutinosa]|uniref:Uncharacterized protein n=1 Tax=Rehmannia glutinosa TaxID=99300 RepID=A0ABR0XSD3_REHGL